MDLCASCGRAPVAPGNKCPACGALADGDPSYTAPKSRSAGISFAPTPDEAMELSGSAGGFGAVPPAAKVPDLGSASGPASSAGSPKPSAAIPDLGGPPSSGLSRQFTPPPASVTNRAPVSGRYAASATDVPDLALPASPPSRPSTKTAAAAATAATKPMIAKPGGAPGAPAQATGGKQPGAAAPVSGKAAAATQSHYGKAAAARKMAVPSFGDKEFDTDLDENPNLKLELDGRAAVSARKVPAAQKAEAAPESDAKPDPDAIHIDPYELQVFADFGAVPEALWQTPLYAIRVFTRRRELRASLARANATRERVEGQLLDALHALFVHMRPSLEAHADVALLEGVRAIEARAMERGAALQSTSTELKEKVAEIEAAVAQIQHELTGAQEVADRLAAEVTQREEMLERMNARLKRVEIELRSTQDAARAAAGPEATVAPPEFAAKLATLMAEQKDAKNDVDRISEFAEDARKPHREALKVVTDHQRRIMDQRKKRKGLEDAYGRQIAVRTEGVAAAERELKEAGAEIARRILGTPRDDIPEPLRNAVVSADQARRAALVAVEKHVRALDSYDRDQTKRGTWVLAGLALVVVLLLVGLAKSIHGVPPDASGTPAAAASS